ncbi:MAG: hypothetical protein HOU81_20255 [Hamadaea sp.]|uniref:DUF6232 family protein n=1 Tax=Hamadaea sp. TaxID=2024425 RepID=UPI00179494C3|nr:DUF6232 family protein [Hamadaea sp.]NUR73157.1 hypothetical protein [Hamadaea sp.]NUT18477.1 hypothetical protein [Hamadaea sp.]
MITFYRDPTVVVTSTYLQIEDRRWRLSELEYVWHQESPATWRVRSRTAGRGVLNTIMTLAGLIGLVILVAFVAAAYTEANIGGVHVPRNTLLLLALVLMAGGFGWAIWEWMLHRVDDSYDKGDAVYEIWAAASGTELLLLRLEDYTRYAKIYRAIERAVEYQQR